MLPAVLSVKTEVLNRCNVDSIDLETVAQVFTELTPIDEIIFVPYDTPPENPIWGRFTRWGQQPAAYAPFTTVVEIAYATHLSEPWRRFVVCKELCHALEVGNGVHANDIDRLVEAFVIKSAAGDIDSTHHVRVFAPELLAECGAIEILYPLEEREALLVEDATPGPDQKLAIAARFNLPIEYVELGLISEYNTTIRRLMGIG